MPLLHLDTEVKLVQYIKMAVTKVGYGTGTCPPRLKVTGVDRERVMNIIRTGIANRPKHN